MIKSDLVQRIAQENPQLYRYDVERIIDTVFNEIRGALSRGERVELRGFGIFSTKERPDRVGRNPRSGAPVQVKAKRLPFFRTSKALRERLNGGS